MAARQSATNHPGSRSSPRRGPVWLAVVCAVLALAVALVGYVVLAPDVLLDLPEPQMDGVDPAVVSAVEEALETVRESPADANEWGRLGMILLAHDFAVDARSCFRRAGDLDSAEPRWPYFHAWTLVSTAPEAALPGLERAVELCGESPLAPRLKLAEAERASRPGEGSSSASG